MEVLKFVFLLELDRLKIARAPTTAQNPPHKKTNNKTRIPVETCNAWQEDLDTPDELKVSEYRPFLKLWL